MTIDSEIIKSTEEKMKKATANFKKDLATLRAGRANPALLEKIMVDYHGTPIPINQLGSITSPEPRLLLIQPWDVHAIGAIEKAIQKSDLGINPTNDGRVIRLVFPELTEERRKELVKTVHKKAEEIKVIIRNLRRDANDLIKSKEKAKEISEDESKRMQENIQKITDNQIKEIDNIVKAKEKEIMEV